MNVDVSPSLSLSGPSSVQKDLDISHHLIAGTPHVKLKTFKVGDTLLSSISLDSVTVSQQSQHRSRDCMNVCTRRNNAYARWIDSL